MSVKPEGEGGPKRPPFFKRRGFTLAELMSVLLIFLLVGGGISAAMVSSWLGNPSEEVVIREGKWAAHWMQRMFYKAMVSRRSFIFRLSPSVPQQKLKIIWEDNTTEVYDGRGRAWFTNRSAVMSNCVFSPQWNTVSPAFTIEVGSSPKKRKPLRYIVVTPYCRVAYRDNPPGD